MNVRDDNVYLYPYALGDKEQRVTMHTTQGSSGDSWVERAGKGNVQMVRLDDRNIERVDFIKLDCEGGELPALRGAEATLLRYKPVVIVEQKPGRATRFGHDEIGAVDCLRALGAELRMEMSGDYILSWNR